ncbi:MAG: protein kinase [Deltaproteobacteria bacterium]|nr:protein kinase [Deltaproteobacteria bacterium]
MSTFAPEHWPALSRLVDRALELPAEERAAFADSLPPEQAHLREPLRELLRGLDGAGQGFLATLPPLAAGLGPAPGAPVGPWRLLRELGAGGMGTVWLAERADGGPARQVALKLPRWSADPAALSRRLLRERDALAALEHPHIARLYDAGVDAAGRTWLAMEYVDGLPIDRYAREHGLPVRERVGLFLQVAEAVAYAHTRLVVHRDLKPPNILVTGEGQVKLLDFGIAKLLSEGVGAPSETTELLGRAFTPDYAAPEQLGDGIVTVATDVYALGVVLFELLAGRRPYAIERNPIGGMTWAIREATPARLALSAAAADRRLLEGDLETIVAKALKKEPDERYATVNELAQDLRRHLADEPVLARPDGLGYRTRKFLARHRLGVTAAAAVALALLAGVASTVWQARVALAERDRAHALLARSGAVMEVLDFLVSQAAARLDGEALQRLLQSSAEMSRAAHAGAPEQEAMVLLALASYQDAVNDQVRARALLDRAGERLRASSDRDLLALVACRRALSFYDTAEGPRARAEIAPWAADASLAPEVRAECQGTSSMLSHHVERPEVALRHARAAQATLASATRASPRLRARVLRWLGAAESLALDVASAERHLEEALAVLGEAGLGGASDAVEVHYELGNVLMKMGAVRGGIAHLEAILQAFAGRTPPDGVVSRYAAALDSLGRHDEAAGQFARAVKLGRESGNSWVEVQSLAGLAGAHRQMGRLDEARRTLEEADRILDAAPGPRPVERILVAYQRGIYHLDLGQLDEVQRTLETMLAVGGQPLPEGGLVNLLRLRAPLALARGQVEQARADARQLLEIVVRYRRHQPHSAFVGRAQLLLGRIEERAGRGAEAAAAYRAAREQLAGSLDPAHPQAAEAAEALRRLDPGNP